MHFVGQNILQLLKHENVPRVEYGHIIRKRPTNVRTEGSFNYFQLLQGLNYNYLSLEEIFNIISREIQSVTTMKLSNVHLTCHILVFKTLPRWCQCNA